ncbi:hypothetical protein [Amniculibacterium sp. G2-70]|uniref:DUF7935 family protein n=1 Tax=Amniculibacterium sp. G2-70 TaxID=2767188 RepID=UPI0016548D7A|nr:hypothetical protein [Amniculibacterium sp. G2-70]
MNFSSLTPYLPYIFAVVVATPFLVLLRQFVYYYINAKERELKSLGMSVGQESRLQAFERMTLFLDRMKPSQLISKFDKNLAIHEFIYLTERSIQEEFDYNSTQQLYISTVNWQNIVTSKNRLVALLHSTYEGLGNQANLDDYKTVFMMNYTQEGDFVSQTIDEIKKELLIINFNN